MTPTWLGNITRVVCIGAHPDDIEIGAGGMLLRLAADSPEVSFRFYVFTGSVDRAEEAEASAASLLPGRVTVEVGGFRDGYLPYQEPAPAKEWLAERVEPRPDLVLAPHLDDRHQDHRFAAETAWQVFRKSTIIEYEVPKWEGDRPECNLFVTLDDVTMKTKVDHLMQNFGSQHDKPWYEPEAFEGMARLRGMETGSRYAEGFVARKLVWS